MLGRKQNCKDNGDWIEAMGRIEELVSREEIEELAAKTVRDVQRHIKGVKSAYAWSGGKDSLVLGDICQRAGMEKSFIAVCDMEYPAFMRWLDKHKPPGCEEMNTGHDLEWLAKHPDLLFPPASYPWGGFLQRRSQDQYYKKNGLDILILGRRTADGNFVGRGTNYYTDAKGRTKYNPLAYWSHEQLLAYIHYHKLPMQPFYAWPDGFKCGTHPWFVRPYIDRDYPKGWKIIHSIDPTIVTAAAEYIPSAAEFLEVL